MLFEDGLRWLNNPSSDEFLKLIIKLVYQATIYSIWKKRNARVHNQSFRAARVLISEIKQVVLARLDPFSGAHNSCKTDITLLGTWFSRFRRLLKGRRVEEEGVFMEIGGRSLQKKYRFGLSFYFILGINPGYARDFYFFLI